MGFKEVPGKPEAVPVLIWNIEINGNCYTQNGEMLRVISKDEKNFVVTVVNEKGIQYDMPDDTRVTKVEPTYH